ncbi:DUF4214 domain-containing protein [Pseudoduganella buxea]|nr:DUF4214 domain-containing protein [Pseudoduganella buxea]GGC07367.1 hypothetical protein GCM10011572_31200 [Pseudoduganella buxea]
MADTFGNFPGGAGNDFLPGTNNADIMIGNGGADTLLGNGGDDQLWSGSTDDKAGSFDTIGDLLDAGSGNDQVYGGAGNDTLRGVDGNDTLTGNAGNDSLDGGNGDDILIGGSGSNVFSGGAGLDKAIFAGTRGDFTIALKDGSVGVTSAAGGVNTLDATVERVVFDDSAMAYDINGNAGKMFRLYQAALDRAPDVSGLGFWISGADRGAEWEKLAEGFTHSAEWNAKYGENSSNESFLTNLYQNALHRDPDAGGFSFWLRALNEGFSREHLLVQFSESAENHAQVIGSIQNGIEYVPYA